MPSGFLSSITHLNQQLWLSTFGSLQKFRLISNGENSVLLGIFREIGGNLGRLPANRVLVLL